MKKRIVLIVCLLLLISCKKEVANVAFKNIKTDEFELLVSKQQKGLLILFPGGGGSAENIKKEFDIVQKANEKGVSLLLINFARKLWIEKEDSAKLTALILETIKKNNLKTDNIYIGGMSIGGNVALTLSDYLLKNKIVAVKGTFIVDSPIDLFGLYESSVKDIQQKDFSEERLAEPKWIVSFFEERFTKDSLLSNIQQVSPFTYKTENFNNIYSLKKAKLRLYTEPDERWWKEVRKTDYESTNAYRIRKLNDLLVANSWKKVTLIETNNKGYRANGKRNPHSWSIVHVDDLLEWILT
ncbi:hypothetical protein [Tenacibaculum bernardetii]|uniref:hypothetical protein n=1 Tax=Tenacibaculum bernardetii TaxID=3021375 RepID=UPI0023B1C7BE|nr:hypothetical protein [Tenacibaculum bernardetii]